VSMACNKAAPDLTGLNAPIRELDSLSLLHHSSSIYYVWNLITFGNRQLPICTQA
jgi:hypothetical protein